MGCQETIAHASPKCPISVPPEKLGILFVPTIQIPFVTPPIYPEPPAPPPAYVIPPPPYQPPPPAPPTSVLLAPPSPPLPKVPEKPYP